MGIPVDRGAGAVARAHSLRTDRPQRLPGRGNQASGHLTEDEGCGSPALRAAGLDEPLRSGTSALDDLGSDGRDHDGQDERDDMSGTPTGDGAAAAGRIEPVNLAVDSRKTEDEQVDDLVAELTALGMNPDREALRTVVRKRS